MTKFPEVKFEFYGFYCIKSCLIFFLSLVIYYIK